MRKLLTFLIALAASISVSASAFAQYAGCLGACGTIAASGAAPFALDGTAQTGTASASSFTTTPFSTTYANDIVYISGQYNGGPITGITGCGLTWTHRASGNFTSGYQELWYAKASSPLVGCAPTVTQTSSSFYNYAIFAFSGAHVLSPFDSNGAIPNISDTSGAFATCTTSNANDILIGVAMISGATPPTGSWVQITYSTSFLTEYQIVTSTQSALVVATSPLANGGGSVCDAIIQGP